MTRALTSATCCVSRAEWLHGTVYLDGYLAGWTLSGHSNALAKVRSRDGSSTAFVSDTVATAAAAAVDMRRLEEARRLDVRFVTYMFSIPGWIPTDERVYKGTKVSTSCESGDMRGE